MNHSGSILKIIPVVLFIIMIGCTKPIPQPDRPQTGSYMQKVQTRVMGVRRSYLVHVPQNRPTEGRRPLVVVIHGAFGTAMEMEMITGFSTLADRENFFVVYPNGAYGIFGWLQHWNAGHCCGKAADDNTDDVGFLDLVIHEMSDRFDIDRSRVYLVGISNGGMLAYRYAAEKSVTVAAVAAVSASIGGKARTGDPLWTVPDPLLPVPVMAVHGKMDDIVPFDGGISPRKGGQREYLSVSESIEFWADHNLCGKEPAIEMLNQGMLRKESWECRAGNNSTMLRLVSIDEWGHSWPGPFFTEKLDNTSPLKGFDAKEMIWEFFMMHQRN